LFPVPSNFGRQSWSTVQAIPLEYQNSSWCSFAAILQPY